jgi:ABC-2 type transport system permease protein
MRVLRDTALVFTRSMRPTLRKPVIVVVGATQPLLFLFLFGPLLGHVGSSGSSWQWFVPGLIIQMALFGTSYAGYVLMPEIRSGVLARFQVTPISRIALLLGRVLRDVSVLMVQCVILLAVSTIFGFHASAGEVLLILLFGALTGISIAATSHALALKVKHEYVFGPLLGGTVMPLLLLSGALLPMNQGPRWLWVASRINPLSYAVDGVRGVVTGSVGSAAVAGGGLATVALMALCIFWGVRTFRTENS